MTARRLAAASRRRVAVEYPQQWDPSATITAIQAAGSLAALDTALNAFGAAYGLDVSFPATGNIGSTSWVGLQASHLAAAKLATISLVEEFAKYLPAAVLASDLDGIAFTDTVMSGDFEAGGVWVVANHTFYAAVGSINHWEMRNVVHHEYAHCLEDTSPVWESLKATYSAQNPHPYGQFPAFTPPAPAGFMSDYARTNVREDFADTHARLIGPAWASVARQIIAADPVVAHKVTIARQVVASVHPSLAAMYPTGPAPTAVVSDAFDRTSTSSPGVADTGQPWTARSGTWGTDGDRLYSVTAADGNQVTIDLGKAEQDISITLSSGVTAGAYPMLLARWQSTSRFYALGVYAASGKLELFRWDPYAKLAETADGVVSNGSGLRLAISEESGGTRLRAYVNSVERINVLDSNQWRPVTGTHIGVRHGASTGGLSIRWNNLTAQ